MNILYQFNEKYAPYAGVSMTSLFENNKAAEFIYIYVLGEDLSETSISKFNELADNYSTDGVIRKIIFVETNALIKKMQELNMPTYRGSYAANMRLFVSEILDTINDRRLLYLDADTIVTGDLSQIYRSDIKTLGMVYDTLGCQHKYELGLREEEGYYNSGVILYDLDMWEENDFTNKIVDHVKNVRAQYPSPDQDLINVVVRNEISVLPFSCNYQPHLRDYSYNRFTKAFHPYPFYNAEEVDEARKNPIIMHAFRYVGEFPWHKGNVHPFTKEFDKYLEMSPWNDYKKEVSNGGIIMKIEKIMYRVLPKALFLSIFTIAHGNFYRKADKLSKRNAISKQM